MKGAILSILSGICLFSATPVQAFTSPYSRYAIKPVTELSSSSQLQMAAIDVAMPALSSTMKEGKIVAWTKKVGDRVEVGDILMVVGMVSMI